jgi:hypothetical protein
MTYNYNYIVTCRTVGCSAEGVSLPQVLRPYSAWYEGDEAPTPILDENGQEQYSCWCGPCGQLIADIVEFPSSP